MNNISSRMLFLAASTMFAASSAQAANYINYIGTEFVSSTQYLTGTTYNGYRIFGLSGIDYNPDTNEFIAVRDNYLANSGNGGNPVAFTLAPVFSSDGLSYTVAINGVNTLGGASGISSLESIRYDPNGDGVWLASESPNTVYHVAANGMRTQITLPANVAGRTPTGSSNYGLEGLTFTPNGGLWVSRETTMSGDTTGIIRLSNISESGSVLAQYAYQLDNVVATNNGGGLIANPPGTGLGNNGVSEILAVTDSQFLVLERGWDGTSSTNGVSHNYIRIYSVTLDGATEVSQIENLDGTASFTTLSKTLIFDSQSDEIAAILNSYDTKIDNIEGISFGADLADGRKTLILVSDNNNSSSQRKTQFIVLALGVAAVPEPATWAMMIAGFAAVGGSLRSRKGRMASVRFA